MSGQVFSFGGNTPSIVGLGKIFNNKLEVFKCSNFCEHFVTHNFEYYPRNFDGQFLGSFPQFYNNTM